MKTKIIIILLLSMIKNNDNISIKKEIMNLIRLNNSRITKRMPIEGLQNLFLNAKLVSGICVLSQSNTKQDFIFKGRFKKFEIRAQIDGILVYLFSKNEFLQCGFRNAAKKKFRTFEFTKEFVILQHMNSKVTKFNATKFGLTKVMAEKLLPE